MAPPTWDDVFEAVEDDTPSPSSAAVPGWYRDDQNVTDFGPTPLHDNVRILECPDCSKVVLEGAFAYHQKNCQLIRDIRDGRTPASVLDPPLAPSRKRSRILEDSDDENEPLYQGMSAKHADEIQARALAKREAKMAAKANKKGRGHRGPLDVDRQCGVMTEKGPCLRSLTCKSHSMGAKRSVEGRSRPYDELLFEWQKATNPAFVAKLEEKERATAAANAAKAAAKAAKTAKKKRKADAAAAAAAAAGAAVAAAGGDAAAIAAAEKAAYSTKANKSAASAMEDPDADMYTLGASDADVEHELHVILEALRRANTQPRMSCAPLAVRQPSSDFVARSHRLTQYRGLIQGALRGPANHFRR